MIRFPQLYRRLNHKMSNVQKRLFARQLRKDTGNRTIHNNDEPSVAIHKAKLHLSKRRTAKRKPSSIHRTARSSSIQRSARYRQRRHSRVNTTRQLVNLIAMALVVAGCSWLMPKSGSSSGSNSGYNRVGSRRLTWEEYLQNMQRQGTYAEDTQIQAYSDMIQQPIWVIVKSREQGYIRLFDENYTIPKIPIIIFNYDQIHFQAVMPVDEAKKINYIIKRIAFVKSYQHLLPDDTHGLNGNIQTNSGKINIYDCAIVECGGGGDCLFHTFAAFSRVQENVVPGVVANNHYTLRTKIVDYLRTNPQKYQQTVDHQ